MNMLQRIFAPMDYYELFGIPVGFKIDQKDLNRTYIRLQKQFHPDFYGQASEEDRALALDKSSMVNKAYRTFKNQDLTIQYFLQEKGLIEEGEQYKLPPDFLMEVMDLNELKMDGAPKEEITEKAGVMQNEIFAEVKELIDNYDENKAGETDWLSIKDYYYKKKYIDRLLAE
jgi:molecular chaperone HscB